MVPGQRHVVSLFLVCAGKNQRQDDILSPHGFKFPSLTLSFCLHLFGSTITAFPLWQLPCRSISFTQVGLVCPVPTLRPAISPARAVQSDDLVFPHERGRQPLIQILDSVIAGWYCRRIDCPLFPRHIGTIGKWCSQSVGGILGSKVTLLSPRL